MIRGDLQPSSGSGDILVEDVSMLRKKAAARQLLGNCPQFDAMDQLTVLEHLRFYARIRGVKNVEANVQEIVRGVGLTAFKNRMGNALSGGNKRKLSLGKISFLSIYIYIDARFRYCSHGKSSCHALG